MTEKAKTIIISISGGSGSGKTTAAKKLQSLLSAELCQILSQDNYYHDQSKRFHGDGSINFDSPQAIDFSLLEAHLRQLLNGETVQVPIYDFVTHSRMTNSIEMIPTPFIIIDGTLVLSQENLYPYFLESIYLSVPEDVRFARRLKRDVEERGRTPEGVRTVFYKDVKPMHDAYVSPSQGKASLVITHGDDVHAMLEKISKKLKELV